MTTTSIETGAYLARLRDKAGFKQNELAQKVTWSPAVLSRVESGERPLSAEELNAILEGIGTEEALHFRDVADRVWLHLGRPPLGHPDEAILWESELALRQIKELSESPDIKNVFAKRLEAFSSELIAAAGPVLNTEQNIAFVGKIGVGKSTALCRVAGLEVRKDDKIEPALEVGAGGTTVCEVRVLRGRGYGLFVDPIGTDEFHREVMEFATFLSGDVGIEPEQEAGEQDAQGTSKEIERAIRNMSGLTVSRRQLPDGKRERIDRARDLAEECADANALSGEIMARIRLSQRTTRRLWYPELSGVEPLVWLKETFGQINKGLHPEFALPKRIDITLPDEILGKEALSICLVDTKGIDATAERADLETHFKDASTVMVMCSSFNDVPSTELQLLLGRAVAAGVAGIGTKTAILALPRSGEALAVKDDQGIPADSVADGYELKGEQAELRLDSQKLPFAGVEFFNANEDSPEDLADFLLRMVEAVRTRNRIKLSEIIDGAITLVENCAEAEAEEVYRQAARRMWVWLENNREIDDLTTRLQDSIIGAIDRAYASSVRASLRRQGNWHNLDLSYHLGYGARVIAASAVLPKLDEFKAVATNLLQDDQLESAFGLVRQARRAMESGVDVLLDKSEELGERIYIQYLEPDGTFWRDCDDEWGQGPGYKDRVRKRHEDWFSNSNRNYQAMALELVRREWRQIQERLSNILDPEGTDTVAT